MTQDVQTATTSSASTISSNPDEWHAQYQFFLWPPLEDVALKPGQEVYVSRNHDKSATGRAVILGPPVSSTALPPTWMHLFAQEQDDTDSQPPPNAAKAESVRCPVQYVCCGVRYVANAQRLLHRYRIPGCRRVLICHTTHQYRMLAKTQVDWRDHVTELGSAHGLCTEVLASHAASVVGFEISEEAIAHSRRSFPNLTFKHLDVLQDVHVLIEHLQGCPIVFVDLGGNRALAALVRCLALLIERVHPELIVVKSEELARLAAVQCAGHAVPTAQLRGHHPTVAPLTPASCSTSADSYKVAIDHVLPPPASPCSCRHDGAYDAGQLNAVHAARLEAVAAHSAVVAARAAPLEGLIPNCTAWWGSVWRPRSCRAGVVVPEAWFLKARAKGFAQHPLKFPWRENADGQPICRLHNYSTCPAGEGCLFDHKSCHHCGLTTHVAVNCVSLFETNL